METRTGNLSINSENMLPIIKKWLYSDHDIFARELVSNGCDAISKLHKLEIMGEYQYPDKHKDSIRVIVDPDQKIAKFIDTGLGMTESEVEEYITQIAFSGASAFFEKYKDKANKDDIIGHFGLGFYSVFMVSDKVEIDSLSWQKDMNTGCAKSWSATALSCRWRSSSPRREQPRSMRKSRKKTSRKTMSSWTMSTTTR